MNKKNNHLFKINIKRKTIILASIAMLMLLAFVVLHVIWAEEDRILTRDCPVDIDFPFDNTNHFKGDIHINTKLQKDEQHPSKLIKNNQGNYYVEFDDTYFGTLKIELEEPVEENTNISVLMGEAIAPDKERVWTRRDGMIDDAGWNIFYYRTQVSISTGKNSITVKLPVRTRPTEEVLPDGWEGGVLPIRCAEISVPDTIILSKNNITRIAVYAPFDDSKSSFKSNNETLNQVYDLCRRTVKATSFCGIYIDGYRECLPYEADAYITGLSHFSVEPDTANVMAKDTINVLLYNHTWPTEWIYHTIMAAREYYMYTGDKEYIESIYSELQDCLMESLENDEGLIDSSLQTEELTHKLGIDSELRDIITWPEIDRDNFDSTRNVEALEYLKLTLKSLYYNYREIYAGILGYDYAKWAYRMRSESVLYQRSYFDVATPNSVVNAFYYKGLTDMSWLATEIGNEEDAQRYSEKARNLKEIYKEKFLSDKGLVLDAENTKHTSFPANLFALSFGLIDEDESDPVLEFLIGKGMTASTYSAQYLLDVMCRYGKDQHVIDLMTSHSNRSWWYMENVIGSKLTTEFWNGRESSTTDWNHAWSTSPLNIITRQIVGIEPYSPGCKTLMFSPHTGDLTEMNAKVPVRTGSVEYEFRRNDNNVQITIDVPVRTVFDVPDYALNCYVDSVKISENEIWMEAGEHIISYDLRDD